MALQVPLFCWKLINTKSNNTFLFKDLPRNILKIAEFLNKDVSSETVKRIADQTSFNAMKTNKSVNYSWSKGFKQGTQFIRKGEALSPILMLLYLVLSTKTAYTHTHTHTHTHTQTHTHTNTHKHTNKNKNKHTNKRTHTNTHELFK